MVEIYPFSCTGYSLDPKGNPEPLNKSEIRHAARLLGQVIRNADLKEDTPDKVVAGDVDVAPGFSSGAVDARVKIDGKWVVLRNRDASTTFCDLASIENHSLNTNHLFRKAKGVNPKLAEMIKFFLLGSSKYPGAIDLNKMESKVSRALSDIDIAMLLEAKIIVRREGKFALPSFKVPKKNPKEARLITDCREINERLKIFTDERMNIPRLHTLMHWGTQYPVIWSIDANAYFFQFKLKGKPALWFPLRATNKRGEFESFMLRKLPMGFSLAPIIAQRSSNLVIEECTAKFSARGLDCKAAAWVDNFIIFAQTPEVAKEAMAILSDTLEEFDIKCKEVDKSLS